MGKRLASAFLALTIIISMFAGMQMPAFAEEGNFDGVIPSTINGYPVTSINRMVNTIDSYNIIVNKNIIS